MKPIRKVKKRSDFRKIQSLRHNRLTNKYFFLYYNPSDYKEVGIQIGKRYLKKATLRNNLKRIITEYLRLHQDILPCMSIVIGIRKNIDNVETTELKIYFHQLIKKYTQVCK